MKSRIPLWLTLVPLALGIALYALLWRGWADDFQSRLATWLPGKIIAVHGFPYRLETDIETPRLTTGTNLKLQLKAGSAVINQGPWQKDLTVLRLVSPQAQIAASPVLTATLHAKTALTSINYGEGRLRRLSNILESARLTLANLPPITADTLELHLRELEGEPVPNTSPTRASQGQLVLSGTRLRLKNGDALTMAAEILATGPARLTSYPVWASTGTLEVTKLTLADAHGEIATLNATLVAQNQTLILNGTLTTTCPNSFGAAYTQAQSPKYQTPEYRLRVPVRLTFSGPLTALTLTPPGQDLSTRPRRTKEPACPKVFGEG